MEGRKEEQKGMTAGRKKEKVREKSRREERKKGRKKVSKVKKLKIKSKQAGRK